MNPRPELGAVLDTVCLRSEDPQRLATFIANAYDMRCEAVDGGWNCTAPGRRLRVEKGQVNGVAYFAYAFASEQALGEFRQRMGGRESFKDPDGNVVRFMARNEDVKSHEPLPARLQHLAFRTPDVEKMVAFYESLGFVVSDRVQCEEGVLRACFLRTDPEHHALALFRANEPRFDHLSCETRDTAGVIAWADRMASKQIPIHWGIGRHGPGNDVFFMVKDPDGNMIEISAELEVCDVARPAGTWRHEQRTLNLWGTAIMRS
jgi:catechol 2,3-dioxygenase